MIAPPTKQEKILTALGNQLQQISPDNDTVGGYSYRTAFDSFWWGKSRLIEYKKNTLVWCQEDKQSEHQNQEDRHILNVRIDAYLFQNDNIGLALSDAEADITDAIAIDERFGENATISNIQSSSNEIEMEGTTGLLLSVLLEITFFTERLSNY